MICGRQQIDLDTKEEYDYIGCEYPYGLDGENAMLFNGEQVELVYFIGYQDLDELNYRLQLIGKLQKQPNLQKRLKKQQQKRQSSLQKRQQKKVLERL